MRVGDEKGQRRSRGDIFDIFDIEIADIHAFVVVCKCSGSGGCICCEGVSEQQVHSAAGRVEPPATSLLLRPVGARGRARLELLQEVSFPSFAHPCSHPAVTGSLCLTDIGVIVSQKKIESICLVLDAILNTTTLLPRSVPTGNDNGCHRKHSGDSVNSDISDEYDAFQDVLDVLQSSESEDGRGEGIIDSDTNDEDDFYSLNSSSEVEDEMTGLHSSCSNDSTHEELMLHQLEASRDDIMMYAIENIFECIFHSLVLTHIFFIFTSYIGKLHFMSRKI